MSNNSIMASLALDLAELHLNDVASMGSQAEPSDADNEFDGLTLSRELRDAGIADWNDESVVQEIRAMLRNAIGKLLAEDATEREQYAEQLRAEADAEQLRAEVAYRAEADAALAAADAADRYDYAAYAATVAYAKAGGL